LTRFECFLQAPEDGCAFLYQIQVSAKGRQSKVIGCGGQNDKSKEGETQIRLNEDDRDSIILENGAVLSNREMSAHLWSL
jgi:hypothetical protein